MNKESYLSKQVIVIRKDLNMRKGKCVAQGSHASMAVLLDLITFDEDIHSWEKHGFSGALNLTWDTNTSEDEIKKIKGICAWLSGRFAKVCCYVNSEEELDSLYDKARAAGLLCSIITDAGFTEFHGVPTKTAIAIGPAFIEDVDKITGGLSLL